MIPRRAALFAATAVVLLGTTAAAPVSGATRDLPRPLEPGFYVVPFAATGGTPSTTSQPGPGPGTAAPGAPGGRTYTVKEGDTPSTIARQFNVSTEALMRANNISDARSLRIGQTLTIPAESTPTPTQR